MLVKVHQQALTHSLIMYSRCLIKTIHFLKWQIQQLVLWGMWILPAISWHAWDMIVLQCVKLLCNFHLSRLFWLVEQYSEFCWHGHNGWDWKRELMMHFVQAWSLQSCFPVLVKYDQSQFYNRGEQLLRCTAHSQSVVLTNVFLVINQSVQSTRVGRDSHLCYIIGRLIVLFHRSLLKAGMNYDELFKYVCQNVIGHLYMNLLRFRCR